MRIGTFLLCVSFASTAAAQTSNEISLTYSLGNNQRSVYIDYFHNWKLGNQEKIKVGIGARMTSYIGSLQYYSSAPASLAADDNNTDSLFLPTAQTNSLNLALNFAYRLSHKFSAGFNIDAIGFSFGAGQNATYLNTGVGYPVSANPTPFNVLLVGTHDRGSLNSEFYLRYFINERFAFKVGFQHIFSEYTTDTQVQQFPEPNNRFRKISSMFSFGITKQF